MIAFLVVLVVVTAICAPLLRRLLQRDKARQRRRWQMFVPRAQVTSMERSLSGYSVEIRALPNPSPVGDRRMLLIDTDKMAGDFWDPKVRVHYDGASLYDLVPVEPEQRRAREALDDWEHLIRQPQMTISITDANPEWFDTMLGSSWWHRAAPLAIVPEFSLKITGVA